jgi:carbon-monoxide dehydrogenase medium subunit/xanthine dehydrogenase FAD-binding subunit
MQELSYIKPTSLKEALALLEEYQGRAKVYAGGTDLMVQFREGAEKLKQIEYLLDCSEIPEMNGIEIQGGNIRVGAMVSHTETSESEILKNEVPFLAEAAVTVGSPQIRNVGTLGGNICNGSPAADTLSPLVALDAKMIIHSMRGVRECLVKDIYSDRGEVMLKENELVVCLELPRMTGFKTAFSKLGRRKALAISRMNVAAALQFQDGVIMSARLVPGCIFIAPDRVTQVEEFLMGKKASKELFDAAGEMTGAEMVARTGTRWSTEYKQPVIASMVSRTLCKIAGFGEVE